MKKYRQLSGKIITFPLAGLLTLLLMSCEKPNSPSFDLDQRYSIPLISEITYEFLGEKGAIIDTTSTDFEDLFQVEPNGLVTLGFEVDFDIGSFDDAIPNPEVNPFEIDANITELKPDITGSGSTNFESVTGLDPGLFPPGSPLIGASSSNIQIPLDMDEFVEAQASGGSLYMRFLNDMGFDIDTMEFYFDADGTQIGTIVQVNDFNHGNTVTEMVTFSDGEIISTPLSVIVDVTWTDQNTQDEPGEMVVHNLENLDLTFHDAKAVFDSQEIFEVFESELVDGEFTFEDADDYVEINESVITFNNLVNTIDIDIETLIISFPTIIQESSPGVFDPADSLVIVLDGENRIRRSSDPININGFTFDVELDRIRVHAPGNILTVNVEGITEDTHDSPPGDRVREVTKAQGLTGTVDFEIIETGSAVGLLEPRIFNLNDSDDNNLDIMDPAVRIETEVEDLETISEKISNLQLTNPALTLHYTSNIGVENRIYAAIIGINNQGEELMLSGIPGSKFFVSPDDTISGLLRNGAPIPNNELLAIDVDAALASGSTQSIQFLTENSNIEEFLSNLPVEIYFVGKALVNPDRKKGNVTTPLDVTSSLGIDIPISLTTADGEPTVFADSVSASLSDLPGEDDDTFISAATLTITYSNLIPLNINLDIEFYDEQDKFITRLPLAGSGPIILSAAQVNENGFSVSPENNMLQIELDEEQLKILNRSERLLLTGELLTSDNESVSIRSSDSITLGIKADFNIRIRVD